MILPNGLYFGDNLEVMREMDAQCIDLICTDPPFNSGRDYNAFLTNSKAQAKAFTDTWTWDAPAEDTRTDIERMARTSDTYKALDVCLKGYDLVLQNAVSGNKGAMRAYLAFMGPRLAEMHRLLKETGSIYLHCDPTASHYLKGVMDAIFDIKNYRNEIAWGYSNSGRPKRFFAKKHDTILLYTKTDNAFWGNYKMPISEEYLASHYRQVDAQGRKCRIRVDAGKKRYYYPDEGMIPNDWWKDIPTLNSMAKERLGYATQKPIILYERMIEASSNEGDLVMDPFVGCGTTIDAAYTLNRPWIGIDLTLLSLDTTCRRLADRHGLQPSKDYQIHGYPTNMQEVHKMERHFTDTERPLLRS